MEKWLQGFENEDKISDKAEDKKEELGGTENLGLKVREIRKRFEEGSGLDGSRERVKGREKDPAMGWDPGKDKQDKEQYFIT